MYSILWFNIITCLHISCSTTYVQAFLIPHRHQKHQHHRPSSIIQQQQNGLPKNRNKCTFSLFSEQPQVFSTGYSDNQDFSCAIIDATNAALMGLPKKKAGGESSLIDLAVVQISSMYDAPSALVPTILATVETNLEAGYTQGVKCLIGSSAAGIVSTVPDLNTGDADTKRNIRTVENEGGYGVSITFALLPDVELQTFHVEGSDIPDDGCTAGEFRQCLGLKDWMPSSFKVNDDEDDAINDHKANFLLLTAPAFQKNMNEFLTNIDQHFPGSSTFGGLASTVSSLSRARLFRHDTTITEDGNTVLTQNTLGDGCLGIIASGDIEMQTMVCQGTKPVGATYQIVTGQDSTIKTIVLDESSAAGVSVAENEGFDDAYLKKAAIPKPVLAEANLLMKTISDDDQDFMGKALLVGIEDKSSLGQTPNELERLANGEGHRFSVYQVAAAGLKDGSITLPLESVDVEVGTRVKFYVRDGVAAKEEVKAMLKGYQVQLMGEHFVTDGRKSFSPTGCMILPTMDRGVKLFGGKPGFESNELSKAAPSASSVSGLFCNGVIGTLNGCFRSKNAPSEKTSVHGSGSGYALFSSKSKRPVYDAAAEMRKTVEDSDTPKLYDVTEGLAPRSPDGELIIKRRDIQSGRAMSVSTVQWSVAEKISVPTSMLEGFMWDKETEVDRFRERVPLSNLVSQVRAAQLDLNAPAPRDWLSKVLEMRKSGNIPVIAECKRAEPTSGSIHKRYNVQQLSSKFVKGGASALSVNCDKTFFGGAIEDLMEARKAVPDIPILASDLILYPYQLYKLYLAGADAVTLIVAALEDKDLMYLTKIAKSLKMQTVLSVTSEVQLQRVIKLSAGGVDCLSLSNRNLEDFSFDLTGDQALNLLKSSSIEEFHEKHADVPILVEGRVGIIASSETDSFGQTYLKAIIDAGATGVIMGEGLASFSNEEELKVMFRIEA